MMTRTCATHPNPCHPERSTTAIEVSRRAQSKDPYPRSALVGRDNAFSQCIRIVNANSLANQVFVKPIGIIRLHERLRARFAQDDNAMRLITDN